LEKDIQILDQKRKKADKRKSRKKTNKYIQVGENTDERRKC
jgi:hypothetical protein